MPIIKKVPINAAPERPSAKRASPASTPSVEEVTHEMIAKRAFEIWCDKGRPWGLESENWRQAEEQLSAELGFAGARPPARGTAATKSPRS
jgi:hypothetical protein